MNPGLKASASGMRAQQARIDAIANNLANVNTTGFKRSRVSFQDLLYETIQGPTVLGNADVGTLGAVQIGRGVTVSGNPRIHTQGSLEGTNRMLDFAVDGQGFFKVQLPNDTFAYTRDGSFNLSDTGTLVTSDGHPVLGPGDGIITLPLDGMDGFTVSASGVVSAIVAGDTIDAGEIGLTRFMNPSGLAAVGGNLYEHTDAAGEEITGLPMESGFGQIVQGYLETSNVQIVQEMVDMIAAQRAYEVNSKAIQTAEEMIENAINSLNR